MYMKFNPFSSKQIFMKETECFFALSFLIVGEKLDANY